MASIGFTETGGNAEASGAGGGGGGGGGRAGGGGAAGGGRGAAAGGAGTGSIPTVSNRILTLCRIYSQLIAQRGLRPNHLSGAVVLEPIMHAPFPRWDEQVNSPNMPDD